MKVDFVEESAVRKALVFQIEPEVVQTEIETSAREYSRRIRLPGFRPGKIPPEVVKKRFHSEILGEAAERIVNRVVFEELEGRGLKPVAAPQVKDLSIEEGRPMAFRAVFETLPIVEVPEWKGLRVTARGPSVTDEDLERELDRLRDEAARFEPVEGRPAQRGDHVLLDLAWRPVEGGKGGRDDNALIEIGNPGNHEDMNRGLEGMTGGETRQIDVSWAADAAPAVAGKTVRYTVTLKGIKRKVVPEADDEFAKDLGEFDSLPELKEKLRRQLLVADERRAEREVKAALVEALAQRAGFEVPEALVERHMTARAEGLARGLAWRGIDPRRAGLDWREYRESTREDSVKAARADILLDEIARREGIDVSEAELEAELARLAERAGKSKEALRLQLQRDGDLGALRARIREEKTLDLLKANASIELT
ncbi:MAG: trigger factor [Acidobacteria bacterium RBG_16_70_10]|nr:MAG: trigger factor [Acidobacteria bacterium RBG_16_70_10]